MKDITGSKTSIPTPPCMVLHCTDESGWLPWRTKTALAFWTIDWTVCSYHYWQLDDGHEYASVTEDKPSTKRWLLMGDDLVIECPPARSDPSCSPPALARGAFVFDLAPARWFRTRQVSEQNLDCGRFAS